jgi:hypothetical protein
MRSDGLARGSRHPKHHCDDLNFTRGLYVHHLSCRVGRDIARKIHSITRHTSGGGGGRVRVDHLFIRYFEWEHRIHFKVELQAGRRGGYRVPYHHPRGS